MTSMRLLMSIAFIALPACAQLDSNSITITAVQTTAVLPDQAVITVWITPGQTTGPDQILAGLQGTGISMGDLISITQSLSGFGPSVSPSYEWQFVVRTPISGVQSTLAAISAALHKNSSWSVNFYVQSTEVSPKLLATVPCSQQDLLRDAQIQARNLATAAGLFAGPVLAMSDESNISAGAPLGFAFAGSLLGHTISPGSSESCSMTVKFQLLRYQ
jgi:hypothetical protein